MWLAGAGLKAGFSFGATDEAQDVPAGPRRPSRLAALAGAVVGVLLRIAHRDVATAVASHACCPPDAAGLESIRC